MRILYKNIGHLVTLAGASEKDGRHIQESDLSIQKNAAIITSDGQIEWMGPHSKIPRFKKMKEIDLGQRTVLPGLVECHTHSVFAGHRATEFEMRQRGVSYSEIAARGGGILSTLKLTRQASEKKLFELTQKRFQIFQSQGVTTIESKTGYALNLKDEIKCLKVAKKAAQAQKVRLVSTFLGAHALPPEFSDASQYLDFLVSKVLPEIKKKKLAERVDIFIEKGFFNAEQAKRYLSQSQKMGFALTVHADQLSLGGGTELAVAMAAQSADHVLQITDPIIEKISRSQTVAVLLPAADLYMKCSYPRARDLIDAGACVAVATDFNPGSSPTQDLGLVGILARLEMKMTLPEVIVAYTYGAAKALGIERQVGSLEVGKKFDISVWDVDWNELFFSVGGMKCQLAHCAQNL